jgi:Na+(H+)/acetate symporter ActP
MEIKKILSNRKAITWEFIVKIIIILVAMGILIVIIVMTREKAMGIIQKLKDIF